MELGVGLLQLVKVYIHLFICVYCFISLYSLQLSPVQPSLIPQMEWSVYLTTTLRAMLPTPVSLATLSMETPLGLVGVLECGVVVNQHVPVSLHS